MTIQYSIQSSPFGDIVIASTSKGICYLGFCDDKSKSLKDMQTRFPNTIITEQENQKHKKALANFIKTNKLREQTKLDLIGTPFQIKVWEELQRIPQGILKTYGEIAKSINKPKAYRAVGTAIGKNPVSLIVPCHRVIQASGEYGNYLWGAERKQKIINWELNLEQ